MVNRWWICLGWRPRSSDSGRYDQRSSKAGVNLIDTAPGYNFGNSEKILGKALEGMNREDVKIITKCGVTWDQEMKGDLFNKVNGIQLYKNLNSESVKKRSKLP